MTDINKLMAEALVECGYADRVSGGHNHPVTGVKYFVERGHTALRPLPIEVNPFADTLEGRRQADALEDWLYDKHGDLVGRLFADGEIYKTANRTHSEWRRFNIKWCFEQLAEKS